MSSATSAVTYTSVYTNSEPGRAFWGADDEEISEGGIPRVIDEDEREPMFVHAHDPDYVPEPIYPEYIPLEDEHEFPAEEQPLPPVDSPTAEDGPVDYPMDGEDDGDDDDGDSSGDDADGEDEDDEDEEEDENLAPADSTIVVPVDEPVFPPEGTKPVIPPPSTYITIGARITVWPQTSISLPLEAEVERLLAMTTLSPPPPISLSPPFAGERLVRSMAPPAHSSVPPALIDAVTAALPSPPLPPLPPSLYIPPPVDRRDDIPKSEQPPHAKERRQGIRDVGYGIRDTWVDPAEAVPEIAPMTVGEVNTRVTELAELHEHDTQVERLLAMTTPSPSPPISLSPPSVGERLARCTAPPTHSSLLPMPSPLLPSSGCPTQIQTLGIASTHALIDTVTSALPSPPLPPLPPSLYIPPPVDCRDDIPEFEQPPYKWLCLSTLGSRYEVRESSTARPTRGRGIDYGFVSIVDAEERR
ncbi:hypothetical protein Tco_0438231 [Tanacetum coccineum]